MWMRGSLFIFEQRAVSALHHPGRVRHIPLHPIQRLSYSSNAPKQRRDDIKLAREGSNAVTLNIFQPSVASTSSTKAVIFYLPTGPVLSKHGEEDGSTISTQHAISSALSRSSNATVVQINYRASSEFRYPFPVHDVLAAYDWTRANLTSTNKFGACGQLLGGSLATSLALTETRATLRSSMSVLAVHNPIVDWLFSDPIDAIPSSKRKKRLPSWQEHSTSSILSSAALVHTRQTLFRNPSSYFDPFASPVLFFRSPGADPPIGTDAKSEDTQAIPPASKRRKVNRIWPPSDSNILLPTTRISFDVKCILADQVSEMAKLMQRSVERSHLSYAGAEKVVVCERNGGSGGGGGVMVWGRSEGWEDSVEDMGKWMGSNLID